MHVFVTGASGFVGRHLVNHLLAEHPDLDRLTLLDQHFESPATDSRTRQVTGNIADPKILRSALEGPPVDLVFHLASVPGGGAEQDYDLGRAVNLDASLDLLQLLADQGSAGVVPRVVFASTIAVYGAPLPAHVTEASPLTPRISYGAHKLIGEILIQDLSRRGAIDGRVVRLPGIVARPLPIHGMLSAFMSEVFWHLRDGAPFECPVSPEAVAWWMSVDCCVQNLRHAAELSVSDVAEQRAFTLPVLRLSMKEVVDGLCRRFGNDRRDLVHYRPNEELEAGFGRFPPLSTPTAEALGFAHDQTADRLIERVLAE